MDTDTAYSGKPPGLIRGLGDGHALFVDDPEKFNHALEEFLHSFPK